MAAPTVRNAILLSIATASRSWSGLAAVSWQALSGRLALERTPFAMLAHPEVAALLAFTSFGEAVADKFPYLPSRTAPIVLSWRMGMGGLVSAVLFYSGDRSPAVGALLGGITTCGASFLGLRCRTWISKRGVAAPLAGLIEDILVFRLLRAASREGR